MHTSNVFRLRGSTFLLCFLGPFASRVMRELLKRERRGHTVLFITSRVFKLSRHARGGIQSVLTVR